MYGGLSPAWYIQESLAFPDVNMNRWGALGSDDAAPVQSPSAGKKTV